MKRRTPVAKAGPALVAGLGVLLATGIVATGIFTAGTFAAGIVASRPADAATAKATTQQTFLTFYGYWDNTPPGAAIAYPVIHDEAGGTGTFDDPITLASSTAEIPKGAKVWVPRVRKYFIMEDACAECADDWQGHGPNGGPNLRHLDLWLGGQGGSEMAAIDCENALTFYHADNTPVLEPVVVDPPSNEPYDPAPLFNAGTGGCYGGAKADRTVGRYQNKSTGQCLNDPNDSTTSGTALTTAACGTATSQVFAYEGAFLSIHDTLCAGYAGSRITLGTCTGGPNQQWSINPDLTISDIQTGNRCFRASGSTVSAGSCSGTASQWTFLPAVPVVDDFGLALTPSSASVAPGTSTTFTVNTTVTKGTAQPVALAVSGAPGWITAAVSPATVTAGGNATVTVSAGATAQPGSVVVVVTGSSGPVRHVAWYTVTVTG